MTASEGARDEQSPGPPGGTGTAPTPPVRDSGSARWADRRAELREAAIQAEYATGRHEETEEAARRGVIRRVATIAIGFVVLLGGLVMLILPGPGILGVVAGLAILAQELAWAERLLEYVKKRAKVEELKKQPAWVQAVMWTITAGAVIGSVTYFTVIR